MCLTFSGVVVQVLDSVQRKRLVQKTLAIVPNVILTVIMTWKYVSNLKLETPNANNLTTWFFSCESESVNKHQCNTIRMLLSPCILLVTVLEWLSPNLPLQTQYGVRQYSKQRLSVHLEALLWRYLGLLGALLWEDVPTALHLRFLSPATVQHSWVNSFFDSCFA